MYSNLFIKTTVSILCLILVSGVQFALLARAEKKRLISREAILPAWLVGLIPFSYGGYYAITSAVVGCLLLGQLIISSRKRGQLTINIGLSGLAIAAVVLGYLVTPLWAADRGMSLIGIAKYFPLILFALVLMQIPGDNDAVSGQLLCLLPLSGTVMTLLTLGLQGIPVCASAMIPDGRMAGFFEYPNAFALFLITGIIVLTAQQQGSGPLLLPRPFAWGQLAVLFFGLLQSGSRIGFWLMAVVLAVLTVQQLIAKHPRQAAAQVLLFLGTVLLSFGLSRLQALSAGTRYATSASETGTLMTRLLYYRDAIRCLPKIPFGSGYYGFSTLQKTFQHGVYHVAYVHNDLLQLIFDVGYLPAALLTAALIAAFFRRDTALFRGLLIFVISAHCMFEFHLAYLALWLILISAMGMQYGKQFTLHAVVPARLGAFLAGCVLVFSLWIGTGDTLYAMGYREACLQVTSMHTKCALRLMQSAQAQAEKAGLARRILRYNPYSAEAWDCLAQQALEEDDIGELIRCSRQALALAPYDRAYILHCIDRAEQALSGGQMDAQTRAQYHALLAEIPEAMERTLSSTDPIAWKIQHTPELTLPQAYADRLNTLIARTASE